MLRSPIAFATIAFLSLGSWCIPEARATEFPVEGSPGAKQRPVYCPDGMYMVGFRGMAGAFINQIGPICASLLEDGRLGQRKKLVRHGGKGGSANFEQYCGTDEVIRAMNFVINIEHGVVTQISFKCYSPATGENGGTQTIDVPGGARGTRTGTKACPSGELAGGVKINYGKHVNGLGLMCKEVVVPTAETRAPAEAEAAPDGPTPMEIAAGFGGTWNTTVGNEPFVLTLNVNGAQVSGQLTHADSQLSGNFYGTLEPNGREILYISEQNNGSQSSGILELSQDGSEISGAMTLNGERQPWRGRR